MSAGALLQTPLGELTVLPRSPSWFHGGPFGAGGELRGGERRTRGGGREKGGEMGMGKGEKRGKLGGEQRLRCWVG